MKKDEKGYLKNNKEKNICGNCNKQLAKNDKYCPYCGTKRDERKFLPFLNQTLLVYGPPISYYYKCKKCGHKWRTLTLGGDKNLFCPKCGTSSIKTTRGIPSFD